MNADIQAFVDDVNLKISAINSTLTRINTDTTGLLAKIEQLQQSTTLGDDDKTALQGIRDGLANVVATAQTVDALVPDAQPPADGGAGNPPSGGDGSQV